MLDRTSSLPLREGRRKGIGRDSANATHVPCTGKCRLQSDSRCFFPGLHVLLQPRERGSASPAAPLSHFKITIFCPVLGLSLHVR